MTTRWLPKAPPAPPFDDWQPWRPAGLGKVDVTALSYIVVDEIVDETCVLAVTEWPRLDDSGRVRFRLDERPQLVRAFVRQLGAYLADHRSGSDHRDRPVRIGDAFAATARRDQLPEPESEHEARELAEPTPLDWLEPPVHDVTADAREVAKVALYGAVAPVLEKDEARRLAEA